MRKVTILGSFVAMFLAQTLWAPVVSADWDPTYPWTKWVQRPDLSTTGMDVNATYLWDPNSTAPQPIFPFQKILADDFLCQQTGPITDIHIWGSWLNDRVNDGTRFKLSIHKDVPAGEDAHYSHPGDLLWEEFFTPDDYKSRPVATANELFYEPNTDQIIGSDTTVWQYNFFIDHEKAFRQEGTPEKPLIYWLDVQAIVPYAPDPTDPTPPPPEIFGWKTSLDHWNDDAVFGDTDTPGGPPVPPASGGVPWKDMHYPAGHPLFPQSIDLAFVITTIPEPDTIVMLLTACFIGLVAYLRRR